MAERIHDHALQHPINRFGSARRMFVFLHRAVIRRPGSRGLPMHGDGVIHKKFNPHGSKAHRNWATGAVRRFLMSKEELGTVNGDPATAPSKCRNSSAPKAF